MARRKTKRRTPKRRRTHKRRRTYKRRHFVNINTAARDAEYTRREAEYKKFDEARTAIAKRLGVSPTHANAHYQALIEFYGMDPKKAEEATWGWQP